MTAGMSPRALAPALAMERGMELGLAPTKGGRGGPERVSGLAVAVVDEGGLVEFASRGYADVEGRVPITPETVFRVGSISKLITAICVLQLVERGEIGLDHPVNGYLRSSSVICTVPDAPEVTIRHLLTHTSGIGELRRLGDVAIEPFLGLAVPPQEEIPALPIYYREGLRTTRAPGEAWTYANHGFGILGLLVEDVTGREFWQYAEDEVLRPLGMQTAGFQFDGARPLAVGYAWKSGAWSAVPHWEIAPYPAGNLYASTAEMAEFAAALLGRGANTHGRVLREDTFDLMATPHEPRTDPRHSRMGLGIILGSEAGTHTIGHDGGWSGFLSSLRAAPGEGRAVLAFTNSGEDVANAVTGETLRALAGQPSRAEELAAMPPVRADDGLALLGHYGAPAKELNLSARFRTDSAEIELYEREGMVHVRTFLGALRRGAELRDAGGGLYAYQGETGGPVFLEPEFGADARPTADGKVTAIRSGFERHPRGGGPSLRNRVRLAAAAGTAAGIAAEVLRRRLTR